MQRAIFRYLLIGVAIVLGMGLAGYAVANTLREPGSTDLGPSIVFTPSPAATATPEPAATRTHDRKPSSAPDEETATKKAPEPAPEPKPAPPAPAPVPVQPAPPVEYDDDVHDDFDDDGFEGEDGGDD